MSTLIEGSSTPAAAAADWSDLARQLRVDIVRATVAADAGHPTSVPRRPTSWQCSVPTAGPVARLTALAGLDAAGLARAVLQALGRSA